MRIARAHQLIFLGLQNKRKILPQNFTHEKTNTKLMMNLSDKNHKNYLPSWQRRKNEADDSRAVARSSSSSDDKE